jgi:hypothetical protein
MASLAIVPDEVISVSTELVAEEWNPFRDMIWSDDLDSPITEAEVRVAIESKSLVSPKEAQMCVVNGKQALRAFHVSRIAWLVENPTSREATEPISIDFGIVGEPRTRFEIWDGNHRFAAHLYSKKPSIRTTWGGSCSEAVRFTFVEEEKSRSHL